MWGRIVPSSVLAIVAWLTPMAALCQRQVSGTVADSLGRPVGYVNIDYSGRRIVADDSGRFAIATRPGAARLFVRRIGFRAAEVLVPAGNDTSISMVLHAVAAQLDRTTITAQATVRALELRGFYQRLRDKEKGINAGQFITAEEIEQRNPFRITQMFEGRSGIKVVRVKGESSCISANDPRCWAPAGVNGCYMTVYYDGRRLSRLRRPDDPTPVDDVVLPGNVAGIEIYTTPLKTPPEYQMLAGMCGVILIWSK